MGSQLKVGAKVPIRGSDSEARVQEQVSPSDVGFVSAKADDTGVAHPQSPDGFRICALTRETGSLPSPGKMLLIENPVGFTFPCFNFTRMRF